MKQELTDRSLVDAVTSEVNAIRRLPWAESESKPSPCSVLLSLSSYGAEVGGLIVEVRPLRLFESNSASAGKSFVATPAPGSMPRLVAQLEPFRAVLVGCPVSPLAAATPNPSLEPTRTGMALGPRSSHSYHPPRRPSAIPALAPQLKR